MAWIDFGGPVVFVPNPDTGCICGRQRNAIRTFCAFLMQTAALAGVLLQVACGHAPRRVDAIGHARQSGSEAVAQTQPAQREVPLVYQQRIVPGPLTPAQLKQALDQAALVVPPGREVWFIQVRTNRTDPTYWEWSALVYFTPDVATTRLRRGKYIVAGDSSWAPQTRALASQLSEKPLPDVQLPELQEYIQVSHPTRPFGSDLTTPEIALIPFPLPDQLADSDTVEIADFARTATPPDGDTRPGWPKGNEPILRIEKNPDTITVWFGWYERWLSAGGHLLEIQKAGNRFEVVKVAIWVS